MLSAIEQLMYFHPASHFGRLERRPSEIEAFEELESRPFRRSHAHDAERFDTPWGVRDVVVTVAILFAFCGFLTMIGRSVETPSAMQHPVVAVSDAAEPR
jgi:hypothetical protein